MRVTAETITDEQIRALWRVAGNEMTGPILMAALNTPYVINKRERGWTRAEVRTARARCADILNARSAK